MKKIISLVLILATVLGMLSFAGCRDVALPTEDFFPGLTELPQGEIPDMPEYIFSRPSTYGMIYGDYLLYYDQLKEVFSFRLLSSPQLSGVPLLFDPLLEEEDLIPGLHWMVDPVTSAQYNGIPTVVFTIRRMDDVTDRNTLSHSKIVSFNVATQKLKILQDKIYDGIMSMWMYRDRIYYETNQGDRGKTFHSIKTDGSDYKMMENPNGEFRSHIYADDGRLYYKVANDGCLYSCDPDFGNVKKIRRMEGTFRPFVRGGYLYYGESQGKSDFGGILYTSYHLYRSPLSDLNQKELVLEHIYPTGAPHLGMLPFRYVEDIRMGEDGKTLFSGLYFFNPETGEVKTAFKGDKAVTSTPFCANESYALWRDSTEGVIYRSDYAGNIIPLIRTKSNASQGGTQAPPKTEEEKEPDTGEHGTAPTPEQAAQSPLHQGIASPKLFDEAFAAKWTGTGMVRYQIYGDYVIFRNNSLQLFYQRISEPFAAAKPLVIGNDLDSLNSEYVDLFVIDPILSAKEGGSPVLFLAVREQGDPSSLIIPELICYHTATQKWRTLWYEKGAVISSLFLYGDRIYFTTTRKNGEYISRFHSIKTDGSDYKEMTLNTERVSKSYFAFAEGDRLYFCEQNTEVIKLYSCAADLSDCKPVRTWTAGDFYYTFAPFFIRDGYLYYTTKPKTETKNGLQIFTASLARAPLSDLSNPDREEILLTDISPVMGTLFPGKLFYGKGEEALPPADSSILPAFRHLYVFDLKTGTETKISSQEGEAGYRFDLTAFSPEYALFSAREKENSMASQYLLVPMT